MKPKNIKKQVDWLLKVEQHHWDEKQYYQSQANKQHDLAIDIQMQISILRSKCKHDYGDQKPGVMGKGICIICGANDY